MATGIQGPQGFKGARGVQGATGWGAIGSDTGPTGPTGPIGWFPNQIIQEIDVVEPLSAANVSALYRVVTGPQGTTRYLQYGDSPVGGFFVFTNQTSDTITLQPPAGGATLDGLTTGFTLPATRSVMLIKQDGDAVVSSYPYSGVWAGTGYVEDVVEEGG
jgi:hypothetical protein